MKHILENRQNFVNEQEIDEASRAEINSMRANWFTKTLKTIKDPIKKLQKAEELITQLQKAIEAKDLTPIFPKKGNDPTYLQAAAEFYNLLTKGQKPTSTMVKLRAAAADAEDKERLELAAAAAKKEKEENNVEDPAQQEKLASNAIEVAGLSAASDNPEVVGQVVQAMGGQSQINIEPIKQKYPQVADSFKDQEAEAVFLFLHFATEANLLKENLAKAKEIIGLAPDQIKIVLSAMSKAPKGKEYIKILNDTLRDPEKLKIFVSIFGKKSGEEQEKDGKPGESDPNKVDPSEANLKALVEKYNIFVKDFYDRTKVNGLREQAVIVNALLAALKALADEESKEAAVTRASDRPTVDTSTTPAEAPEGTPAGKRDDLYEENSPPKDIRSFKAAVRSFQRAMRASKKLVSDAQSATQSGKTVGKGYRDKLIKFATATQKTIISLNSSLNSILAPVTKSQNKLNESSAGEKFIKMLEDIEQVHDDIASTNAAEGGLAQIINNLEKGTDMLWPEIEPVAKKALEKLNTIKKYFPSLVPFEGGEVEGEFLSEKYNEAITKLDLDVSDIQTLSDAVTGEAEKVVLMNFQTKLIQFSEDIQKIFGVKGLNPEEDSAKAKGAEAASPEAPEAEVEAEEIPDSPGVSDQTIQNIINSLEPDAQKALELARKRLGDNAAQEEVVDLATKTLQDLEKRKQLAADAKRELEAGAAEAKKQAEELNTDEIFKAAIDSVEQEPEQQKQEKVISTEKDLQKFFSPTFINKIRTKVPEIENKVVDAFAKFFVLYYNRDENVIPDEVEEGFSQKLGANSTIKRKVYFEREKAKALLMKMKKIQTLKDEATIIEKWINEAKPNDIKRLIYAFIVQWKRLKKPKFDVDLKRIGRMQASRSFEGANPSSPVKKQVGGQEREVGMDSGDWAGIREQKLIRLVKPLIKDIMRGF